MKQDIDKIWYQGCKGVVSGSESDKKAELKRMEQDGLWVAQDKRDGEPVVVHGGQELVVVNRYGNTIKNHGLPAFPQGTLLVGELAHGTQTAVKRKTELGHGVIDLFDILFFNHEYLGDLPSVERRKRLERWYKKMWKSAKPFYNLLPVWHDHFVQRYDDAVEGLIIKKLNNGKYEPGTKTPDWIKVKKELDVDMVVMDIELSTAATKSNVPMCKHIIAGQYVNGVLKQMVKVGSMDNDTSIDVAANLQKYKGKVIAVKGFAPRFKSGSLRHPSLIRFRDDKKATDCIWEPE